MARCCAHGEDEHETATICEEQIHYPSEDYPCLCDELEAERSSGACVTCDHPAAKHLVTRTCQPHSAAPCDCRSVMRGDATARPGSRD